MDWCVWVSEKTATFTPATDGTFPISYTFTTSAATGSCKMETPVTGSVVVNPLPVLTLNYATAACVYDAALTPSLSHGMGTLAVSPATAALNTTTGVFTPASATAGNYTITYNYTDGNGCVGDAVTDVITINPRPVTNITMNPTAVCDYTPTFGLKAQLANGTALTTGTFSGTGVTGRNFNPAAATQGTHTITFEYSDPTTGCEALPVTHNITVNHTNPPIGVPDEALNTDVPNQTLVPDICATGTDIKWYSANDTNTTVVLQADCYKTTYVDDLGKMKDGLYPMYATQTLNGCQSEPVQVILTITNCPIPKPTAIKYHACTGETNVALTAIGTGNDLGWWRNFDDIPTSATFGDEDFLSDTWTSHGITAVGSHTVYVAEYDPTHTCFGPPTPVELIIHELPDPKIQDLKMICYTQASVNISIEPAGSVLSGAGVSGTTWTPQFTASATGVKTTTLTLDASQAWGSGTDRQATCTNQTTLDVDVTNVLAPTGTGILPNPPVTWGIASIASLPPMEIDYYPTASLSIKDSTGTVISTSSPLTMYPTHISKIGKYSYDVTQTLNSCVSPIAKSIWIIVNCPTPAPILTPVAICEENNGTLPSITAVADGFNFEWRDSTGLVIETTKDLDLSTFGNKYAAPGRYTFSMSQEKNDAAGMPCRGPEATVTFTVNPTPVFTIALSNTKTTICQTDPEVIASPVITNNAVVASMDYSLSGNSIGGIILSGSNGSLTPASVVGAAQFGLVPMTITATLTDSKGCEATQTRDIEIQHTPAPAIDDLSRMTSAVPVEVTGTGEGVKFYSNQNASRTALTGVVEKTTTTWTLPTSFIDPTKETLPAKDFFATQTIHGCESTDDLVRVELFNCPVPRPSAVSEIICNYDDIPTLTAIPAPLSTWFKPKQGTSEFRWFTRTTTNPDDGSRVAVGDTYTPLSAPSGDVTTWHVAEYSSFYNCMSPTAPVSITVNYAPAVTISTQRPTCVGLAQPTISASVAIDIPQQIYWYKTQPTTPVPADSHFAIANQFLLPTSLVPLTTIPSMLCTKQTAVGANLQQALTAFCHCLKLLLLR
ncbi:MAG: hypothetical protein IPO21_20690 [Bacteroidales bacterium]|nr:hypothetical protein [Bacteroidales bacterium]